MKASLSNLLSHVSTFSDAEVENILQYFKPRKAKKDSILLYEGEPCLEFYYVHKGILRTYFRNRKGQEKTRLLMPDHSIGTALTSFITQKPSFETVHAAKDCELLVIHRKDFYRLCEQIPNWQKFYTKILEMAYVFQNERIHSLMTMTSRQRYDHFQQKNPLLFKRLTNKLLASYLDMAHETLSRTK